ncbi:hypothetical protein [Streptomyces broussonetiae]|uniref:hypothetical protein n=1 Tax=Streptomyces broussonetiae TaxID=2686304 RepID=UPI001E4C2243|nr:hypothetical protein [Streptomyces broussonetiae]
MDHTGIVLGQRRIDDKSNETPAFAPLLTGINLQNTVITADAAHTQHANGTPAVIPPETHSDPWQPSASPDQPGRINYTQ